MKNKLEWIPVTTMHPRNGQDVLMYSKAGGVAEGYYSAITDSWCQFRWSSKSMKVTHWMPLPEPPEVN